MIRVSKQFYFFPYQIIEITIAFCEVSQLVRKDEKNLQIASTCQFSKF